MRAPAISWSCRSAGSRAGRTRDDPPANRHDDNRLRPGGGGGGDAGAARRVDRDQSAARVRLVGAICRQRRRADLLRRPAAAHARGRTGRRRPGDRRRRLSRTPPQPARDAVHARRVLWRGAWRDAGHHVRLDAGHRRNLRRIGRRLRWRRMRRHDRLCARTRPPARSLDRRPAARRRDAQRVFLGADPLRAVLRRLRRRLPYPALADGRPRRQQLSANRDLTAARPRCLRASSRGWRGR